jgi:NADH dehydrogenase [ubiquinone] 1 alpha subcomplex assembly factor 6
MKIAQQLRKISVNVPKRRFATTSLDRERAVENCVSLVKQHDIDSYLAGRLLPQKYRGPYFAVRAFHVELALVKDQSRGNVMSGRMRFQFWRDSIEQVFSEGLSSNPQTPVARALHCYKQEFSQSQRFFIRAIDARYL